MMHTYAFDKQNNTLRWHDILAAGTPLIYLHGLGCASSSDYPPVVTAREYPQIRSWLVDIPGAGFSDKPVSNIYNSSTLALLLYSWISSTCVPCFNLFGHSAGAFIALKLARLMSGNVSQLILCEPGLSEYGISFLEQICAKGEAEFINTGFSQLLETLKTEGNDAWLGPFQTSSPQAIYQWAGSALADSSTDWIGTLAKLRVDKKGIILSDTASQETITQYIQAGCQVIQVPNSGHLMAYDNPEGLAAAISLLFKK